MLQVDSHVWNQIAPLAKNPVWKARMQAKDNDALIQEMESLGAKLRDQGVENKVILAYQVAGPLLAEQAAIRTFLRTHPQYNQALPQVETPTAVKVGGLGPPRRGAASPAGGPPSASGASGAKQSLQDPGTGL